MKCLRQNFLNQNQKNLFEDVTRTWAAFSFSVSDFYYYSLHHLTQSLITSARIHNLNAIIIVTSFSFTHFIVLLLGFCRSRWSFITHSWYSCFWMPVTCFSSLAHLFSSTFPSQKHQTEESGVIHMFCIIIVCFNLTDNLVLLAVHQSVGQPRYSHPGHTSSFPAPAWLYSSQQPVCKDKL